MNAKKRALGKGLDTLLQSPETDITSKDFSGKYVVGAVSSIQVDQIETNPFQPRTDFEETAIMELAESIKAQGIITPVTVRKLGYDKYQLISGERRLRASKIAGLFEIPAYIRIANDEQMLEMALVENIQRENLNPLEVAISFQRLIDECELTQEELSNKVGKDRTTVTNYLRLLKLPAEIQKGLHENKLGMGHARTIINIENEEDQLAIYKQIIRDGLSVRSVETLVRSLKNKSEEKQSSTFRILPVKYELFKNNLKSKIESKVAIKYGPKGNGSIVINFKSNDELDRIISKLDPQ
jgi:ParB family chromosome partitioning protein